MRRRLAVVVAMLAMLALLAAPMIASADTFLPVVLRQDSSGPVAPTATGAPTATTAPTATATATATPTATPSPTATATPHWVQLITDGGFELGTITPWLQSSSGGYQLVRYGAPASSWAAGLCGSNGGRDAMAQFVTIPADAIQGGTSFAWYMSTLDNPAIAKDFLSLWLLDEHSQKLTQIGGVDNRGANGQWMVQTSANLAAYRGLTVGVHFECTNDAGWSTRWYVDDVSFLVQVP